MHRISRYSVPLMGWFGVVVIGIALWLASFAPQANVQAQELPPRPTLTPQPTHRSNTHKERKHHDTSRAPTGRITGTVIDLTTSAPAPGITVAVGDVVVTTDADGNYNRTDVPSGSYVVALLLNEKQGVSSQEPITVDVAPGATVFQHLNFRSQLFTSASPTAAIMPLPSTQTPEAVAEAKPKELPRTGDTTSNGWLYMLMLLGISTLLLGATLQHKARQEQEADT